MTPPEGITLTEERAWSRLSPSSRALLRVLARSGSSWLVGRLELVFPGGTRVMLGGDREGPAATLEVRDRALGRRLLGGGAMAFAESYMDGAWDTPDLSAVLDFGCANIARRRPRRLPSPKGLADRMLHVTRANTKRGARRNIEYHYDLGNDFYRLWLDETLTYSCGLFERGPLTLARGTTHASDLAQAPLRASDPEADVPLAEAQVRKWDRLLALIDPKPGEHILEIGCGWGGFAVHAARTRGVHVTGVTISREQLDLARARVAEAGVEDLVDIRMQDYRDVSGTFDHVASIEMFEAVGERYWPSFFSAVRERLRDGGTAALQVITIADERFDAYRRKADFTQKYIFPGGMLPSPSAFSDAARRAGLAVEDEMRFGRHYALTLERWLESFERVLPAVRELGFDERFARMWRYYLAYCRAGFRNDTIDVMQVALRRA